MFTAPFLVVCLSLVCALQLPHAGLAIDADPSTFDDIISGTPGMVSFVGFFAPWCGHCQALKPAWERLQELYKEEPGVQIVSVDADKHRSLGEKYGVQGFPTLKLFSAGASVPEDYSGSRNLEDFIAFLNKKAETDVSADGSTSSKAGLIPEVHPILTGFARSSEDEQKKMLEEAKSLVESDDAKKQSWQIYAKVASKIMTEGADYITREVSRLSSMLSTSGTSITMSQRKTFKKKINVLNAFDEL